MVWVSINHQLLEPHDNQLWFSCSDEVKVNSSKEGEPHPSNQSINRLFNLNINQLISFNWKTRQLIIRLKGHQLILWLKDPWMYSSIEKSMNWFFNRKIHESIFQLKDQSISYSVQLTIQLKYRSIVKVNKYPRWRDALLDGYKAQMLQEAEMVTWRHLCHMWHIKRNGDMCHIQHMTCVVRWQIMWKEIW